MEDNYEPFGTEWEAEMNKLPKKMLIDMIRQNKQNNSITALTELQKELGYKEGELSTVAMLGLVGEAGEVLAETEYSIEGVDNIDSAIRICAVLDTLKKRVRKGSNKIVITLPEEKKDLFKSELADTVYYANILAINIGTTLSELCKMAHDKVRAKMETPTGSSEQQTK